MIESILVRSNVSARVKLTVKSLIAVGVVVLAVALPQLVHLAAGASGGVKWLPMYLPVLLGGCLLGWKWGLGLGVLSPLCSFLLTSAWGNPMPAAVRLPYMMAELVVFAAVSGLFSKKIAQNAWMAFPAVLLAQVSGRAVLLMLAAVFQTVSPLTASAVWGQIQTGLLGLVLQAVLVPLLVMALDVICRQKRERE